MTRHWTYPFVSAAMLLGTACGGPADKLEGTEINTTACDQPNVNVAEKEVAVGAARGLLAIHKSAARGEECERIYWGHFTPKGSSGNWAVTMQREDGDHYGQQSEPNDPNIIGFTVATHGKKGDKIVVCLTTPSNIQGECIDTTVV